MTHADEQPDERSEGAPITPIRRALPEDVIPEVREDIFGPDATKEDDTPVPKPVKHLGDRFQAYTLAAREAGQTMTSECAALLVIADVLYEGIGKVCSVIKSHGKKNNGTGPR